MGSDYQDTFERMHSLIRARVPLILFQTLDPKSPERMVERLYLDNDDEDIEVDHILRNGSDLQRLKKDGTWEDAEELLQGEGGGPPRRAGGGGGFMDAEMLPPNSVIYYPNIYRAWADEGRLGVRAGTELHEYYSASEDKKTINIIKQPISKLPTDDESMFQKIEYSFPDVNELKLLFRKFIQDTENQKEYDEFFEKVQDIDPDLVEKMLRESSGMTGDQFRHSLREMATKGELSAEYMREKKIEFVETTGGDVIYFRDDLIPPEHVGGLYNLKDWVDERETMFKAYDAEVRPEGILMVGPPGTGKSMGSEYIAGKYDVPLLEVRTSKLMSKYQGESQQNLRKALDVAEACSPCVLFFDEVEKMLSGGGGGDEGGGGAMQQMLGMLLTWMNDNDDPVFVIMTCNELDDLPPELKRRGRLDDIFAVSLPEIEEKIDVLKSIMGGKFGIDTDIIPENDQQEMDEFDTLTNRFANAEIVAVIEDAITAHQGDKDAVTWEDLKEQADDMQAIASIEYEDVEQTLQWCRKYGTWAN